jgi:hypothetical protein
MTDMTDFEQRTNYYLKLKGHELYVTTDGFTCTTKRAMCINRALAADIKVDKLFEEMRELYVLTWLSTFNSNQFEVYTNNGRDDSTP